MAYTMECEWDVGTGGNVQWIISWNINEMLNGMCNGTHHEM